MNAQARPPAGEVRTTCPYCGVGCGVLAKVAADGSVSVRGDPEHPANFGRLCSKGSALGETMGLDGRLLHPQIGGRRAGWDEALELVARRFAETIAAYGPDSVAFYVSGQLLTEDYYVANKLMKGFIGSANIDTNSRLCMASSVAGHRRAFGEDIVPGSYEDFEEADLVVLTGSNAAWCHPVLYQRLLAARAERGTKIVVIDPRRTATADGCDLHLALDPGTDVLVFNGLLAHLAIAGAIDQNYVAAHTNGFADALSVAMADAPTIRRVAEGSGLRAADLRFFYELFATTQRTVTVYSQGVNQSSRGTDKVNAIINCHLATGRVGRPGMGPFSITGQPNAMGGREVGGLANQLAGHMGFDDPADIDRVGRFWNAPAIARRPGLKAVDMFRAVGDGRVKAIWIMGTNPAVSMPAADRVRAALKSCDFVVVSDIVHTDTTRFADVLLPAAGWSEKDGTVTNSERRMSRQRPFAVAPGNARPDWSIVCDVARRMGFGAYFDFASPAAIFREHAALSSFENCGSRLFDIGALSGVEDTAYDDLAPRLWPARERGGPAGSLLGDGGFSTPDRRARFIAVRQEGVARPVEPAYPIALNTGRQRDQWHTMTRTGRVPRLMANAPHPTLELNPADAASTSVSDGDVVRVIGPHGFARARAVVTEAVRPGHAFLPMHWSGKFAANSGPGSLASPVTDPVSGQPELKHAPVIVVREPIAWTGVLVTHRDLRPTGFIHWSRRAVAGGWVYELAGLEPPDQGILLSRALLARHPGDRLLEYRDRRGLTWRAAGLTDDGKLAEALFVSPVGQLPNPEWIVSLLSSRKPLARAERLALLSGRAPEPVRSLGRTICSCFNVGANEIAAAIAAGCASVEQIGERLGAGTNCGSCRSEIRTFFDADLPRAAGGMIAPGASGR